jgi:protein-S-isoprenylcysteine O-methyltransferase Ste14
MLDAPSFRLWPPVALGTPLACGIVLTAAAGDPVVVDARWLGWTLAAIFAVWNGWALITLGRAHTALLPGGATSEIVETGPFRLSRNPLYVGLVLLDAGLALLWPSFWALVFVPAGFAALWWGAVGPEERYLTAKFGDTYADYRRRVRRWL